MSDETPEMPMVAGIPVVTDASLPRGVWQLRDGWGNVVWEFREHPDVAPDAEDPR